MLKIPVAQKTFTNGFLGGNGELEFTGSTALGTPLLPTQFAEAQPFPDEAGILVAAKVGASTPTLMFGSGNLECTATFGGGAELSLKLLRPADGNVLPPGTVLPADHIGILLTMGANAAATGAATIGGPAGFSFGVSAKAGAAAAFERYLHFQDTTHAKPILDAILSDIRLPQSRGTLASLPVPGELVQFSYSGFLELAAALNWGYSLTGSEGVKVRDIEAKLEYALRAKASITLAYRLAGEYAISARRGHDDGWARLSVRKRRDARFQAAAGFEFLARADVTGFPESANEFLAAFLGADAKSVLDVLDKAVTATDPEQLEARVGKLLSGVLTDLAEKWTGGLLDSPQLGAFLANVRRAVDAYKSIDDRIVHLVMELYEKTLGPRKAQLEKALAIVKGLSSREDLKTLSDADAWALIQQIAGGDVFTLAFGDSLKAFADVQAVVATVLDILSAPDFEHLRDLIGAVTSRLKLDELFGELEKVSDVKKLRELRDKTLQGLVERVVGKTFDEVLEGDLGKAVKELNETAKGIQAFKNQFAAKMQAALHQSVELRLNYLYTRATADATLIDVEVDVRTPAGERLFAAAAEGRIRPVLDAATRSDPATRDVGIVVHDALLTHEVTRSSQLQLNAFGWEFKRLVEVVAHTDVSLEAHAGGLVQVYTTAATLKEATKSGRKHKEEMQTQFLMRMAGEAFGSPSSPADRDFLVRTIERMSVDYDFVKTDDMTDIKELTEYLALGRHLGLVPDGLIPELAAQFGPRLGKVSARYTVRFDHKTVHDAFTALSGAGLDALVRSTARRMVSSRLMTRRRLQEAPIGFAYAHVGGLLERQRGNTLQITAVPFRLPGAIVGGQGMSGTLQPGDPRLHILGKLFAVEDALVKSLVALDAAIDDARMKQRAVPIQLLEDTASDMLKQAGDIDEFADNTFFGIFDAMVRVGGLGKAHRESALVLEITPPGGQKVTKFFMDTLTVPAGEQTPVA